MKLLKSMAVGLFVVGLIAFLATASFAKDKYPEAFIKTLNDSAVALQKSNPDLAKGLTEFAKEEESEKLEKEEKNEAKEMNEPEAMKGRKEAHIKLLKDSAAALQKSHPDLAKELTKHADRKSKKSEGNKEDD